MMNVMCEPLFNTKCIYANQFFKKRFNNLITIEHNLRKHPPSLKVDVYYKN